MKNLSARDFYAGLGVLLFAWLLLASGCVALWRRLNGIAASSQNIWIARKDDLKHADERFAKIETELKRRRGGRPKKALIPVALFNINERSNAPIDSLDV